MKQQNELISELRKNRKLSQAFLAAGVTTREAVSHFENRGTNISANTLFQFLEKMNIFPEEYYFLLHDDQLAPKQAIAREGCQYSANSPEEENYLNKLDQLYNQTNDNFYLLMRAEFILRDAHQQQLDLQRPEFLLLQATIINYLNTVTDWGRFELLLLNNTLFIFDTDYILTIFKNAVVKMHLYSDIPYYKMTSQTFLLNALALFWERGEFAAMKRVLPELHDQTTEPTDLYARLMLRVYTKVTQRQQDFCLRDVQRELDILNELGADKVAKDIGQQLAKYQAHATQ